MKSLSASYLHGLLFGKFGFPFVHHINISRNVDMFWSRICLYVGFLEFVVRMDTAVFCYTPPMKQQAQINQGDVYWIQSDDPTESELGHYSHPYVVIQDDLFNHSRVKTVIVCALTSNLKRANDPGNVLLEIGEANLPERSVVVVSKVSSVNKIQLGTYIGSLSQTRIEQILAGMRFLQLSFFTK